MRFEDLQRLGGWTKFVRPDDLSETQMPSLTMQTGTSYGLCTVYVGLTGSPGGIMPSASLCVIDGDA